MGIPVVSDLPVGDNLQEHPTTSVNFILNSSVSYDFVNSLRPLVLFDFNINRKNQLTSNLIEGVMYVKTKYANQKDDWPDIQLHMIPGILNNH